MKKLVLLFITVLLSSCSNKEDSGSNSKSTNINPPVWIQGYWLLEIDNNGEVTDLHGYKVTKDDFYLTQIGAGNSMKNLISNTLKGGGTALVEESISDTEYKLNIKLNGISFPQYYFKKISSTKIQIFDTAGKGGANFNKQ